MLQRIILTLILLLFFEKLSSQNLYSDSLLYFETEIFYSVVDSVELKKIQKIDFILKSDSLYGQILNEIRRVNFNSLPETIKSRFLWNASLISYMNDTPDLAFLYWKKYQSISLDTSIECQLIGYLTSSERDTSINRHLYSRLAKNDSLFIKFEAELNKSIKLKGNNLKKVSSFIVPGSGLIINGNIGKGLVSLSLNTGIILLVRYLILSNAWGNSILWGTNLIGKFYLGNYRLTLKEIEIKNLYKKRMRTEKSAHILNDILGKYPLNLKLTN